MIEASFASPMGSWSPQSIMAGLGSAIDRMTDVTPSADDGSPGVNTPGGAAAAFERALAEELRQAGDVDPFDFGPDLKNGAVLSKAGESQAIAAKADQIDAGGSSHIDAAEQMALAGSHRRVGFDGDDGASRSSADKGDGFDQTADRHPSAAFRIGDRVATHPAFLSLGAAFGSESLPTSIPTGRVFFNGDGRPIVLSSIDAEYDDQPAAADASSSDGDLMILPNGAILSYDPWTASVDGPLQ